MTRQVIEDTRIEGVGLSLRACWIRRGSNPLGMFWTSGSSEEAPSIMITTPRNSLQNDIEDCKTLQDLQKLGFGGSHCSMWMLSKHTVK